jgi:hypothetical protein
MNTYKKTKGGEYAEGKELVLPLRRDLCVISAALCVSAFSFFPSTAESPQPSLPHCFFTSLLLLVITSPFPCNLSSVPRYSSTQRQFNANAEMTATE